MHIYARPKQQFPKQLLKSFFRMLSHADVDVFFIASKYTNLFEIRFVTKFGRNLPQNILFSRRVLQQPIDDPKSQAHDFSQLLRNATIKRSLHLPQISSRPENF